MIAATNNAVRKRTAWNAWRERMEQWRKPPPTKLQNVEARRTRLRPVVRRSLRRWFLASCGQRVRRESTGQRCDALSYAAEFVRAGRVRVLRLSALHRWQSYALRNRTRLFWSVQQQSSVAVSMRNALCFWSVRAYCLGLRGAAPLCTHDDNLRRRCCRLCASLRGGGATAATRSSLFLSSYGERSVTGDQLPKRCRQISETPLARSLTAELLQGSRLWRRWQLERLGHRPFA